MSHAELEAFLNTLSFLSSHRLHVTHVTAELNVTVFNLFPLS
jgi:hypothetical protein